jgi:hypothetical protein
MRAVQSIHYQVSRDGILRFAQGEGELPASGETK